MTLVNGIYKNYTIDPTIPWIGYTTDFPYNVITNEMFDNISTDTNPFVIKFGFIHEDKLVYPYTDEFCPRVQCIKNLDELDDIIETAKDIIDQTCGRYITWSNVVIFTEKSWICVKFTYEMKIQIEKHSISHEDENEDELSKRRRYF